MPTKSFSLLLVFGLIATCAFGQLRTRGEAQCIECGISVGAAGTMISSSATTDWVSPALPMCPVGFACTSSTAPAFAVSDSHGWSGTSWAPAFAVSDSHGWSGTSWAPAENRKATDERPVSLIEVRASAKPVVNSELASARYMMLAKSIGLDPSPALDEAKMLGMLNRRGFGVYDYDKVDNYLYHQALKQGTQMRWVWEPLRYRDLETFQQSMGSSGFPGVGFLYAKLYGHPVPERVLERVAAVIDDGELPDVVFMISHYEVIKPDPFLAISTPKLLREGKIYIIDQWNEPGFTEKPVPVPAPAKKPTPSEAVPLTSAGAALWIAGRRLVRIG